MFTNKIRVVALIGQLGHGGSERQLLLLMSHLNETQFEKHVIVFNPSKYGEFDDELRRKGVSVWKIPNSHQNIRSRIWYLIHKLRELKADIVHSWTRHDNPYAGIAGLFAGVPVRWGSVRGSLFSTQFQQLPFVFRYLALWSVKQIVVNANSLCEELKELGYPPNRITILPNCVDTKRLEIAPDLTNFGINEGHRVVGIVGNLRQVKNQLMFVEGMAQVLPYYPDVRALIVGQPITYEADLPNQIQSRIDTLGLHERVVMTGFRSDTSELMWRFDILCLTSRSEGVPNSILEAMAAGCPVIATRVGGVPEILTDRINGFLVKSEDISGFAQTVREVLDNPQFAKQVGRTGQEMVHQQCGCEMLANKLATLYIEALGSIS